MTGMGLRSRSSGGGDAENPALGLFGGDRLKIVYERAK